ncbi:MAG: hypothetical protein HHAS10_09770 [Candidatus Altimarinota bacterium]
MPNLIIREEEFSGVPSTISFPQLVLILSFLKKRGENQIRICGVHPLKHPEVKKIVEVIRRGGFDSTFVLSSEEIKQCIFPENITQAEIIVHDINSLRAEDIKIIKNTTENILLEFEVPAEKDTYKKIINFCESTEIRDIRYRVHHPEFGEKEISTLPEERINSLFEHIVTYKNSFNISLNCGISRDLFSSSQKEKLSQISYFWNEGCSGYVGRYDIYPNGEIKKCKPLKKLYGIDGLRLENFDSENDLFLAIDIEESTSGCITEKPYPTKDEMPFDNYPGFYEEDNRKNRHVLRTTKELIEKKNTVVLPPELVRGKSVLDLGSCIGAMGQWALFYGAKSYTGVEIQESYAKTSRKLLAHHGDKVRIIQSSLEKFLSTNTEKFDIVLCLGVIYVAIDYYSILRKISEICNDFTVIESFYPDNRLLDTNVPGVLFVNDHGINLSTHNASLMGRGSHISPSGLDFLMSGLGMTSEGDILQPMKIYQGIDSYRIRGVGRYMKRYHQGKQKSLPSLSEKLEHGIIDRIKPWEMMQNGLEPKEVSGPWEFGNKIAHNFFDHAKNHIPNYEKTIDLCLQIVQKYLPNRSSRILEFGSAIGYTLEKFERAGYRNILGIEKSESMYNQSTMKEHVRVRDTLIDEDGLFSAILANWTLHFIEEREPIIQSFYNHLEVGGILIITDKVSSSGLSHELYMDFKRSNGLSEDEIQTKTKSLKGVLFPFDITWYFTTLKKIGFSSIDIITASPSFVTFLIQK